MRRVVSAGGIILHGRRMLLVLHPDGYYGFLKGHVEHGETIEQAAIREVREEGGLHASIIRYFGRVSRRSTEDTGEVVDKDIELFLMQITGRADNVPEENIEWVAIEDVLQIPWYAAELAFLQQNISTLVDIAAGKDPVADGQQHE